jgi:lysophospholipase L1-like esterase
MSLLASLLLSLGMLEGAFRVHHAVSSRAQWRALPPIASRAIIPSQDPELVFEFNPGFRQDGFTVNSRGMAGDEVTLEKPAGAFRIAFVGDSISANFKLLPRSEIYLNVIERTLNHEAGSRHRFEVLNFGVNGYGLLQDVRILEKRVLQFDPDVVVVQLCLNDPYPSDTVYAQIAPEALSRLWLFLFSRLAPQRFHAWTSVERNYDGEGRENVRRGLARLAYVASRGTPILAVLFPYLHAAAYDRWRFGTYHELYRRAAADAGLPLLDLYDSFRRVGFDELRGFSGDPIHPGRQGHALAAAEIVARLGVLRMLPGAASQTASNRPRADGHRAGAGVETGVRGGSHGTGLRSRCPRYRNRSDRSLRSPVIERAFQPRGETAFGPSPAGPLRRASDPTRFVCSCAGDNVVRLQQRGAAAARGGRVRQSAVGASSVWSPCHGSERMGPQ